MFVIYGKTSGCPSCTTAKQLLESKGIEYQFVDVLRDSHAMQLFREKGFRGVPQIYKDGEHIGNEKDLRELLK